MPKERSHFRSSEGRYNPTAGSSLQSRHHANFSGQQHNPSRGGPSRSSHSFSENPFEQQYHSASSSSGSRQFLPSSPSLQQHIPASNISYRSRDFIPLDYPAQSFHPYIRSSSRNGQYRPTQVHSLRAYRQSSSPPNSSPEHHHLLSSNSFRSSRSVHPNFLNQPLQSSASNSNRGRNSFFWNSSDEYRPESRSIGSNHSRLWNHSEQRQRPFTSSMPANVRRSFSQNMRRPPLRVRGSSGDVNKLKKVSPVTDIEPRPEEMKEWDDVHCPVCMEQPHNAVLLSCSSHDKGCRPFMCDTSYRHSNCLDQFRKGVSNSANVSCPLCRGQVSGWRIIEPARRYMNSKVRSCSKESCAFSGAYEELRKHARKDHPDVRPSEVDPERQRNWRKMEEQQGFDDLLSTMHPPISNEGMDFLSNFFVDLRFGTGGLSPFEDEGSIDEDGEALTIDNWWEDHGAWPSHFFSDEAWEELELDVEIEQAR